MLRTSVLFVLFLSTGCGLPQLVTQDVRQEFQKCLAQQPNSPFVVEWTPEKHAVIEDIEDESVVIVSYDGCNALQVLDRCRAPGGYKIKSQSVRSKTVRISDEGQLWAKLPLGAAGLKGHLSGGNSIELNYVLTGLKKAKSVPERHTLKGECSGATHFISAMFVGAFEVTSGTATEMSAEVSAVGAGGGGSRRRSLKQVSQNGDVNACKSSGLVDGCKHTIRLKLEALPWPSTPGDTVANNELGNVDTPTSTVPKNHSTATRVTSAPSSVKTAVTTRGTISSAVPVQFKGDPLRPAMVFKGHSKPVTAVGFSGQNQQVLSASKDGNVTIWSAIDGRAIRTLLPSVTAATSHETPVLAMAVSPSQQNMVLSGGDNKLVLWNTNTGAALHKWSHRSGLTSVAFGVQGKTAIAGYNDATLSLWDIATGNELNTFYGHKQGINTVAISPNGKWVASGSSDSTIRLWDLATGQTIKTMTAHKQGVTDVAFSPNSQQLVSTSNDRKVDIWEVPSGVRLKTITTHTSNGTAVTFHPNGRWLLSASDSNALELWDVETGKKLRTYRGHKHAIQTVAISSNGKYALSGSNDNTAILWVLPQ